MIYDYSNNPPQLATSNQANISFPAFYFDANEIYFIYPAEAIIYNFTIGHFFKLIGPGQYQNIVLPAVSTVQMGALIGYTQADPNQLPTLYYTNGRLTLQHANCRNIGWHPRKQNYTYVYGNILHPNNPKVFKRGDAFSQEQFDQQLGLVNEGNLNQARLIELYYDGNSIIVSRHVSRSQLILGPPPNFALNAVNQFFAAKEVDPLPF